MKINTNGTTLEVPLLDCKRCKKKWYPQIRQGQVVDPVACPFCKSPVWKTESGGRGKPKKIKEV